MPKAPGFAVGTNFGPPFEGFRAVSWASHPAFQSSKGLHEQLLDFVTAEQLPPYLPYDSGTNARIFALPFQVSRGKYRSSDTDILVGCTQSALFSSLH